MRGALTPSAARARPNATIKRERRATLAAARWHRPCSHLVNFMWRLRDGAATVPADAQRSVPRPFPAAPPPAARRSPRAPLLSVRIGIGAVLDDHGCRKQVVSLPELVGEIARVGFRDRSGLIAVDH